MNINNKENSETKSFSSKSKDQYDVSQCGEHDCSAHNEKRIEVIIGIQVCLVSEMNINYKENGGKKSFSYKSKASISCTPMWRTWL